MEYASIIETLLSRFPDLQDQYARDKAIMEGIPYAVYGIIFVHYIVDLYNQRDLQKLKSTLEFVEELTNAQDPDINSLVVVAVIESLVDKYDELPELKKYLGRKTLENFIEIERFFEQHGQDPSSLNDIERGH